MWKSLFYFVFLFQERLSYIGPEEFVQAFAQKDPLDNDKVTRVNTEENILAPVTSELS